MSEFGDILQVAGFGIILITAFILNRKLSPEALANLLQKTYKTFRMSVTGKAGVDAKKRGKLDELMTDFVLEEIAPDIAEGMIPGVPPVLVKWIMKKISASELGDFLKENPYLMPDALGMAGQLFSKFQEGLMSGQLDQPGPTDNTEGW